MAVSVGVCVFVSVGVFVNVFVHCGIAVGVIKTPLNILFVSSSSAITSFISAVIFTAPEGVYCIQNEPLSPAASPAAATVFPSTSITKPAAGSLPWFLYVTSIPCACVPAPIIHETGFCTVIYADKITRSGPPGIGVAVGVNVFVSVAVSVKVFVCVNVRVKVFVKVSVAVNVFVWVLVKVFVMV